MKTYKYEINDYKMTIKDFRTADNPSVLNISVSVKPVDDRKILHPLIKFYPLKLKLTASIPSFFSISEDEDLQPWIDGLVNCKEFLEKANKIIKKIAEDSEYKN